MCNHFYFVGLALFLRHTPFLSLGHAVEPKIRSALWQKKKQSVIIDNPVFRSGIPFEDRIVSAFRAALRILIHGCCRISTLLLLSHLQLSRMFLHYLTNRKVNHLKLSFNTKQHHQQASNTPSAVPKGQLSRAQCGCIPSSTALLPLVRGSPSSSEPQLVLQQAKARTQQETA